MDEIDIDAIRNLYPGITDEQVQEIGEWFGRYVDFVLRTYDRIQADPEARAHCEELLAQLPKRSPSHHP